MAPQRKLAELYYEISARTDGLQKDLAGAERSFGKLTSFVLKNPVAAMTAFAASVAGAGIAAARAADQIEGPLRRIATNTGAGAEGLSALRKELQQLSTATGRSQQELAAAAEEAAKTARSTVEVGANLRAALMLSQASGADLTGVLQSLDQVLDLFGHSAASSAEDLALLFSVAKGRQPVEDLFAQLQAAAPAITRLGLDIETAARALVGLGEKGLSAKQTASELNKLAEQGAAGRRAIEDLAKTIPEAVNPMGELAASAKAATDNVSGQAALAAAEWQATWIDFGRNSRSILLPALRTLTELLASMRGTVSAGFGQRAFDDVVKSIDEGVKNVRDRFGDFTVEFQRANDATTRLARAVKEGAFSLASLGTAELKSLIEQLLAFQHALPDEKGFEPARRGLQELINAAVDARNKLEALDKPTGGSGGTGLDSNRIAQAAKVRQAALEQASAALDRFRQGAFDAQAASIEFASAQAEGFQRLANITGDSLTGIDAAIQKTFTEILTLGLAAGKSEDEIAIAFQAAAGHLIAARAAAAAMNGALSEIKIPPELSAKLRSPLAEIREDLKKTAEALRGLGLSSKQIDEIISREEIERVRALLASLGLTEKQIKQLLGPLGDVTGKSLEAADAIRSIGTAAISILGAFGALDQQLQNTARGIVNIGAGIADIASGKTLLGSVSVLGGVADLIQGLTAGDPEAERRHQEALAALKSIQKHTGDLVSRNITGNAFARARTAASAIADNDLPFRGGVFTRAARAELAALGISLEEVQSVAEAFGVTLDGSRESWQDLKRVLDNVDLQAITDTFAGLSVALDLGRRLTGTDNPLTELIETSKLLARFSPEFAAVFDGLDLNEATDRAIALQRVIGIWNRIMAGDDIDFGDLTVQEFLAGLGDIGELIQSLIPEIAELPPVLDEAGEGLQEFTDNLSAFARDLSRINLAQEFGSLTVGQALQEMIHGFARAFTESASQLDFSSLASFRETAAALIASFFADGQLTDAEREQIDALRHLLRAFEAATEGAEGLTDGLDEFTQQTNEWFRQFDDLVSVLGHGTQDQLQGLINNFRHRLGETDLLEGIADPFSAEGQAKLKQRLQQAYVRIISDGVTAEEAPLLEAIQRMLRLIGTLAQEQADAVEEWARKASDAIQTLLDEIQFSFDLEGIDDPIVKAARAIERISAATPEIAAALSGISDPTGAGRQSAIAALVELGKRTTNADLRAQIMTILSLLRSIPDADLGVTPGAGGESDTTDGGSDRSDFDAAQRITVQQADRLVDFARTQTVLLREISRNTLPLLDFFPRLPTSNLLVAPSVAGGTVSTGPTPFVFRVHVENHFAEGVPGNARAIADASVPPTIEAIDRGLQELAEQRQLAAGITRRA